MIRLLQQHAKAGLDVRVIGKVAKRGDGIRVAKFGGKRLHVRGMVRDGDTAFVGSQSLRALELDGRREVGMITKDGKVVKRLLEIYDADWAKTDVGAKEKREQRSQSSEPELAVAASR
jgi:phosphatidylserine/phosphatidylglycerophosphate/cardiolipin synthase-like enzyme